MLKESGGPVSCDPDKGGVSSEFMTMEGFSSLLFSLLEWATADSASSVTWSLGAVCHRKRNNNIMHLDLDWM